MAISVHEPKGTLVHQYGGPLPCATVPSFWAGIGAPLADRSAVEAGFAGLLDRESQRSQLMRQFASLLPGAALGLGSRSRSWPRRGRMSRLSLFNSPLLLG